MSMHDALIYVINTIIISFLIFRNLSHYYGRVFASPPIIKMKQDSVRKNLRHNIDQTKPDLYSKVNRRAYLQLFVQLTAETIEHRQIKWPKVGVKTKELKRRRRLVNKSDFNYLRFQHDEELSTTDHFHVNKAFADSDNDACKAFRRKYILFVDQLIVNAEEMRVLCAPWSSSHSSEIQTICRNGNCKGGSSRQIQTHQAEVTAKGGLTTADT